MTTLSDTKLVSPSYFALCIIHCALVIGCGSYPPPENKPKPSPSPTPYQSAAMKVEKVTNVGFDSYSDNWPVNWQWIDPDSKTAPTPHDTNAKVLRIRVPAGKDLGGDKRNSPRFVKALTGDFQIETRVKLLAKANYQGAGLLIYRGEDDYLRFEKCYGGAGGGGEGLRFDVRQGGKYEPLVTPNTLPTDAGQVDLKIVRKGVKFTAYWRPHEKAEWSEASSFESDYPETILAGVSASSTASELTADFAYIRLTPVK